jgi:F-type H+-transporting ATPase subunit a
MCNKGFDRFSLRANNGSSTDQRERESRFRAVARNRVEGDALGESGMAGHSDDVFHHVRDATVFEVPKLNGLGMEDGVWEIPQIFGSSFTLTKFMILEVVAAVLAYLIFTGLAKRIANGEPAKGRFWNFWEAIALFLRDQVVRPTIGTGHGHGDHGHGDHGHGHDDHGHGHAVAVPTGAHPADKYLPFVWSCFFFILFCNLLGAIPFLGSPTGHIWMTSTLALFVFLHTVKEGVAASGPVGFVVNLCPHIDAPAALKPFLVAMLWVIEFFGLLLKHAVLGIRLFANIMAGHTVIATMLGFIGWVAGTMWFYPVAFASIGGQVAVGLLELLVAFIQAYVFAFLTTIFIGAAVHPH